MYFLNVFAILIKTSKGFINNYHQVKCLFLALAIAQNALPLPIAYRG